MDDEHVDRRDAVQAERFARALSAVGKFGSGHTDISVEHDRELDDIYAGKPLDDQVEPPRIA
jgi:predicted transport protein